MRILILAAILGLAAAPAVQAAQSCSARAPEPVALPAPPAGIRAQRLDRLPDARAIRAVIRTVAGCQVLDVLRERVSTEGALRDGPAWVLAPESRVTPATKKR
jgi:hypothetical protein